MRFARGASSFKRGTDRQNMAGDRPHDTQQPRWRQVLAIKTSMFAVLICAGGAAKLLLGWEFPWVVIVPACLGSLLCVACWYAPGSRREGVWQMAEVADSAANLAIIWYVAFRHLSLAPGWWIGPLVVLYAPFVWKSLRFCCREIRQWPEFTREHIAN